MISFLDAFVDIWEVGAESRYGFEDGASAEQEASVEIRPCPEFCCIVPVGSIECFNRFSI